MPTIILPTFDTVSIRKSTHLLGSLVAKHLWSHLFASKIHKRKRQKTLPSAIGLVMKRAQLCSYSLGKISLTNISSSPQGNLSVPKQGNLIIDTNHRIYAYTTSELRIALYSIFSIIKSR